MQVSLPPFDTNWGEQEVRAYQVSQAALPGPAVYELLLCLGVGHGCDLALGEPRGHVEAHRPPAAPELQNRLPICQLSALAAQVCASVPTCVRTDLISGALATLISLTAAPARMSRCVRKWRGMHAFPMPDHEYRHTAAVRAQA